MKMYIIQKRLKKCGIAFAKNVLRFSKSWNEIFSFLLLN